MQQDPGQNGWQATLLAWATQVVSPMGAATQPPIALQPLPGDAGFRRYCRLTGTTEPLMAVFAPPSSENSGLYLAISRLLQQGGVRVPRVIAQDLEQGFLLVEDCGDRLLLPALNPATADRLYGQAMDLLFQLQGIPVPPGMIGTYDEQKLRDEMALFPSWFIQELLGLPLGRMEHHLLNDLFDWLVDSALEQPAVLVHRDYHSRNLMLHGEEMVTIDFQDAVTGPLAYDLVSLLRDCYIQWPAHQVRGWALRYRQQLLAAGRQAGDTEETFLRWFDLIGLQRHIKVLGIFARLWLRDGKAGYLKDLPLVWQYTLGVAGRYPAAAEFVDWMQVRVLPACQRQAWWTGQPSP